MKILIAEDNEVELKRAIKIAEELGFEVVTAMLASVASRACCQTEHLQEEPYVKHTPLVDGVVTDIFMPYFEEGDPRHNAESPCGVQVALAALACGIPVVFCTGGHHHGSKFQWIQSCASNGFLNAGMIDSGRDEQTDAPKNWRKAIELVKRLIENKQKA